MERITAFIGTMIIAVILIFIVAIIGGTILWIIWDDCIPHVFKSEVLSKDLTWWQAVTLTWVAGILIKSSSSSKSKN